MFMYKHIKYVWEYNIDVYIYIYIEDRYRERERGGQKDGQRYCMKYDLVFVYLNSGSLRPLPTLHIYSLFCAVR